MIGEHLYHATFDLLLDCVAEGLLKKEEGSND